MKWETFNKWITGGNKLPSRDEVVITSLINKYLKQEVKKLVSPISDEFFLIDELNQIYICISDNHIKITNHVFHYNKSFNINFTDGLKDKIKNQIEIERQELKKEIFKNEIDLLQSINSL